MHQSPKFRWLTEFWGTAAAHARFFPPSYSLPLPLLLPLSLSLSLCRSETLQISPAKAIVGHCDLLDRQRPPSRCAEECDITAERKRLALYKKPTAAATESTVTATAWIYFLIVKHDLLMQFKVQNQPEDFPRTSFASSSHPPFTNEKSYGERAARLENYPVHFQLEEHQRLHDSVRRTSCR